MKTLFHLEVVQDAASLKWFVLQNGLMDTAKAFETEKEAIADMKRQLRNKARRERHDVLTSMGLKRVKGGLGTTFYE